MSAVLVVGTAIAVSVTVSDHLEQAAIHEAVRTTEAVVQGFMNPVVTEAGLANPAGAEGPAINQQLGHLVATGKILRIKVWAPDGTIVFSDLAALRGARFGVDEDLAAALRGDVATNLADASDPENVYERGLAQRFLSVYIPIRAAADGPAVGAYEVYEDAAPIEADIARTRQDVLLIVGAMALALLALLFAAFSGTSRLLARQNRRLREQASTEQSLMTDLRRSEQRFRSLVQNSADVDLVLREDHTIAYESPAIERVLGYCEEERLGHSPLDIVHPEDRPWVEELLGEVAHAAGMQASGEFRARHADGSWRVIDAVFTNLLNDPAVAGIVVNYRDVTARKALEDELKHQAFHDSLTGLANRALFADRLEHALLRSRRARQPLAVLFIDLDDFKTVNDSLGHVEGDQLLVAVAERLSRALRASDTIARMGGDEFAVLIEDPIDARSPVDIARGLLASLEAPFRRVGKELFAQASVGVAVSTSRRQKPGDILRNADAAMYVAKANGKNRVEVYDASMHAAALARLALKGDLERALERGEFQLVYQPIIRLASGEIAGVEALLRWHHPRRGPVDPAEFIPVAEETGLIVPLGHWVLDRAARQARAFDVAFPGRGLMMSVNVSGRQVSEPGFVDDVGRVVAATGIDASRLILEFTEGVLIRDTDSTLATLDDLRRLGVLLAIDDFGTGYSSLGYLRRFPIDLLKIDRSFVAGLGGGADQRAMVRSIVKLAATLHLRTVAEGVEDAKQLAGVRALGSDFGQGNFLARPMTSAAVAELLGRRGDGRLPGVQAAESVA